MSFFSKPTVSDMWNEMGPEGPPGVSPPPAKDGQKGDRGITGADGKSFRLAGEYDPRKTYEPLDIVAYRDALWAAKKQTSSRPMKSNSDWMLMLKSLRGKPGRDGVQGPRGRKARGTDSTTVEIPVNFVKGKVVCYTGGAYALADNTAQATAYPIGVSDGSNLVVDGIVTLSGLTPGVEYFLGASGNLTTTAPTTPTEWVVRVGRALSTTQFEVEISQPVLL
jgi:hypothetical protein